MVTKRKILLGLSALALSSLLLTACESSDSDDINYVDTQTTLNKDGSINFKALEEVDNFKTIKAGVEGATPFKFKEFANYLAKTIYFVPSDIYSYKDSKSLVGKIDEENSEFETQMSIIYSKNQVKLFDLQATINDSSTGTSSKESTESKDSKSASTKAFEDKKVSLSNYLQDTALKIAKYTVSKDGTNKAITEADFKKNNKGYMVYEGEDYVVFYNTKENENDEGLTTVIGDVQVCSKDQYQSYQSNIKESQDAEEVQDAEEAQK